MGNSGSFTGRERELRNRASVRFVDAAAQRILTVVGIGTIFTVLMVCVFLVYVSVPLFARPQLSDPANAHMPVELGECAGFQVDEYGVLGWVGTPDGVIRVLCLDSGEILKEVDLSEGKRLTAVSFPATGNRLSLGFADGTVRLGELRFASSLLEKQDVPEKGRSMRAGETYLDGEYLYSCSDTGFRRHEFQWTIEEPVTLAEGIPVRLIDSTASSSLTVLAAVTGDGALHVRSVREQRNLLTGEVKLSLSGGSVPISGVGEVSNLIRLKLLGGGNGLVLAAADGTALRYDARNIAEPVLAETFDFLDAPDARLTSLEFLLGQATLLAGDSEGGLGGWFLVREETGGTPDGWRMTHAHDLAGTASQVTCLASSERTRTAIAGYADGHLRVFNVTTETVLAKPVLPSQTEVTAVALAPKEDALFALGGSALTRWDVDIKHPEGAMAALFLPVWYEGMPRPMHIWQSTGAHDAFEPKLGLMPLIFGTLKATVYSLIFGVPIALLAAMYTSEFLHPRMKTAIKPTIELMASLPSVVLGFIGALVLAPFVEDYVIETLDSLFILPVSLLVGAQVWQLLPQRLGRQLAAFRLCFVALAIAAGLWLSVAAAPWVERWLFAGDFRSYMASQIGNGAGAWMMALLPASALAVVLLDSMWIGPRLRTRTFDLSRNGVVFVDLGKCLLSVAAAVLAAYGLALLLSSVGFDPRGGASYVGTYVQRNAMIVGFVMGFAVIPIVYTIAEDALSTVPEHLRAASLGAGATPWQTAIRIVLPAAMSGLFSAIMIGLGRAVGETMIVLMAAGNTPIMEWNVFNGLRTLSANIAVELPEAPKDSTHYRTLFMAALVLFAMTFVVNTVAEFVRLRFRKKASSL